MSIVPSVLSSISFLVYIAAYCFSHSFVAFNMFFCRQHCRSRPHLCRNARVPETQATLMSTKRKPCAYLRRKSVPGSLPSSRLGGTQERMDPGSRRLGEAVELLHTFFVPGSEKQEPHALPWPCTPPMGEGREQTDQGTHQRL